MELAERRRRLRRQRRWRSLQSSWRAITVSGFTVGLVWITTLPAWVIRQPNQIQIEGNQLLSPQAIQSLLPIAYPQSLLSIQPQAIAQHLESQGPIAQAIVTRQLFPPSLSIHIQERRPVAIAYTHSASLEAAPVADRNAAAAGIGLLDEKGNWMPLESYTALNQSIQLPTLKVIGTPEQYRTQWVELYQAVSRSPIKVTQIDWHDPANLILSTDLGIVHFGSFGSRFSQQLRALDQMRQLPQNIDPNEIAYIDLTNPEAPMIQMVEVREVNSLNSP